MQKFSIFVEQSEKPSGLLSFGAGFLSVCFFVTTLSAEDRIERLPGKPIVKRPIVKPVINYEFTVQKNEQFAGSERPEASAAVIDKGLSVTIQPEKKEFAANGPFAFRVVLKNVSEKPFLLYRSSLLSGDAKLVISNQKTGAQWTVKGVNAGDNANASSLLQPGGTLELTARIAGQQFLVPPQPMPLPQPIPRPRPFPIDVQKKAEVQLDKPAAKKQPAPIGKPGRPIVAAPQGFPCGQGPCKVMLTMNFKESPAKIKLPNPHWTGQIATKPAEFSVGQPNWKPVPPIRPPVIVNPTTKEEAIKRALPLAEQTLVQHYRPAEPFRPKHQGNWIENAEKTASVKKLDNGGWVVQWTNFPKTGFSYNVKVVITSGGGASVTEVFTNYTPAP